VVAFNVKTPKNVEVEAAAHKISLISSPIIYRLMEDVRAQVIELLPTIRETKVTGEATILQLFDINVRNNVTKKIAGCRGRNGTLLKNQHIRVMRQGVCMHEGKRLSAFPRSEIHPVFRAS
jgi:translation initiation factor IF-2